MIPVSASSETAAAEIRLEASRHKPATQSTRKSAHDVNNLSARSVSSHSRADETIPELPAARPPRLTKLESPPRGSQNRKKNWSSHVSSAYIVRKYQLLGIWCGVLLVACAIYWLFLREHIPPAWAAAFCFLVFIVGLLYNSESSNVVNEALTFVIGMTVFGVLRVLSHRKVLHCCQCRMCDREVSVSTKLGEGSFGAVYKARTTHRAPEGAGVKCVVKRVPVDFDKDINDGEPGPKCTLPNTRPLPNPVPLPTTVS